MRNALIFIVGPTAIGKTRLAVKLARLISGEIISCDSMQVYKGMRILSQIPTAKETENAVHHLIGILDPKKEYSVAMFIKRATRSIKAIIKKGKVPIIVGGSGLYAKALIDGIFPSPEADERFRKDMYAFVKRHGRNRLHRRLSKIDPAAAENIHPNDARRIIRALEIHRSTGKTMSELKSQTKGLSGEYDIKIFGLIRPRQDLYSNIESRVDAMFEAGLVNEVAKLRKRRRLSKTAEAILGFKEVMGFLNGEYDLDTAKELLKRNTRRFAKRQLAWFRADRRIRWFDISKSNEAVIIRHIAREVN